MKLVVYIALLLLAHVTTPAFADAYAWMDGWSGRGICAETHNTASCARALEWSAKSTADNRRFLRKEKTLQITLASGDAILKDQEQSGESVVEYSYIRYLPSVAQHVVYVQLYEGGHFLAISHTSGKQIPLMGFPIVSPDRRHLLTASEDMFAGYSDNGVEVFGIDAGQLDKHWRRGTDWGPRKVRWIKNHAFEVAKVCYGKADGELVSCGKTRFFRAGDEWVESQTKTHTRQAK